MSRRIAHRPRYRNMRYLPLSSPRSHRDFFRIRWMYRRQEPLYEKHELGYGLSLIPISYHMVCGIFLRSA
jgi:hypothetical protein